MNAPFPFGFSGPTALYLSLYVITLVIHVAFMNYVVAGTGYLTGLKLTGRAEGSPSAVLLGDWLTVALSVAITAGVAPLLFLQILYKTSFYTANLLLFHRWMLIVPALIVGFYLLYLMKSDRVKAASPWLGRLIGVGALACFLFTGFTWTENHMLSQRPEVWASFYTEGGLVYTEAALAPRLAIWMIGGLPSLALLLGWQRALMDRDTPEAFSEEVRRRDTRRLGLLALVGMGLAVACGAWYASLLPESLLAVLTGPMAGPYAVAAALGTLAQCSAWILVLKRGQLSRGPLILASVGLALTLLGSMVLRESLRLSQIDIADLTKAHAEAAAQGGSFLFVAFFVINAILIGWCIRAARRAGPPGDQDPPHGSEQSE